LTKLTSTGRLERTGVTSFGSLRISRAFGESTEPGHHHRCLSTRLLGTEIWDGSIEIAEVENFLSQCAREESNRVTSFYLRNDTRSAPRAFRSIVLVSSKLKSTSVTRNHVLFFLFIKHEAKTAEIALGNSDRIMACFVHCGITLGTVHSATRSQLR
jgi:hypothetical protein